MDPSSLIDELPSRYVVGMDLGTTNSAVAYVDTAESPWQVRIFSVPQLVAPGQVEARDTLPSFHYQPAEGETPAAGLRLPWSKEDPVHAVGFYARDQGAVVPGRLIASAKSWLCHSGVDRTAPLLPWHGAADVERLSPVEVSARYLRHVREAWDVRFPTEPLARQDFVLTLPASFDEVARELTIEAAARAGLARVVLIEEPQAAFYAWVYKHADNWETLVRPGQKILVCDVGGGTSDFTLIRVRRASGETTLLPGTPQRAFPTHAEPGTPQLAFPTDAGAPAKIQFHRVAVGEHLILGGDNLDLALAHHIERRLKGDGKLEPRQWDVLVRVCRQAKETLLSADAPERYTINLPGSGSRLIGGGVQVEVTQSEVFDVLVNGFFPAAALDDKPASRRSGFQEFGLPYATDPAVTKYLAAFLTAHRNVALDAVEEPGDHDPARPDVLLYNGGLFASDVLRERVYNSLANWFRTDREPDWTPRVLDNDRLDLAVARGAAYYGMVRRGEGVRIAAGLARSYYIGVESGATASAICLVPGSAEPGQDVELANRKFELLVSEPVEFPLYISSTRLTDLPGDLIAIDREQMRPLPPIRTVLRTRRRGESGRVSVTLHARLSEIGTIELWCAEAGGNRSWRLQFDVRSATQTDVAAHESAAEREGFIDETAWNDCRAILAGTFAGQDKPDGLMKRLATALGQEKHEWPTSLLRRIWEELLELEAGRRKSQTHEARWLNLLGYALRPGYGLAVDDWRVAETWRNVQGKLAFGTPASRTESWILWRRIAGGLSAGQQVAIADPLLAPVRGLHRRLIGGKTGGAEFGFSPAESSEMWRLLGSLELLPVGVKIELGNMLVELAAKPKMQPARGAMIWSLGRLGARVPLYGPLNTVPPADVAARWLEQMMQRRDADATDQLAVMQLARRTDDRYRDLSPTLRGQAIDWLEDHSAPTHFAQLVRDGGRLDAEEQGRIFGESLPSGLRIII